jgi:hypothetical protein
VLNQHFKSKSNENYKIARKKGLFPQIKMSYSLFLQKFYFCHELTKYFKLKSEENFFYTVLLSFLSCIIRITLRIFSYGDDLSLFVPSSDEKYLRCNQVVAKRFFSKFEHTLPLNDVFLKEKPGNGYRIFILGESTVQGFPYDVNLAFSRILQRRLQDIFPYRTIEVINLGLTAISSYTLLDFVDEVLQQKPDVILIYTDIMNTMAH